ncbi:hypothetical protein [Prosthecobacter sp.]|uniref:hypothetical protein n=1 Tax=Prosthecobacter sp. TaxID=1965333 RepID=UPI002ABBFF53|nr:hypothetical protein [Prosthecobacter sp.]MDZ4406180.1 hypothetical protein [Prosthecobacter sp.]
MLEQTAQQSPGLGVWNRFDSRLLDRKTTETIKAVKLEVSLSPYDIPQAYRGYYCTDRRRFVVEFKYITEEPTFEKRMEDHLVAVLGKKSGRLYALVIDVDGLGAETVKVVLQKDQTGFDPSATASTTRNQLNNQLMHAIEPDITRMARG